MKESKGFAITSMVLGIVSVVFFCCTYIILPVAVTGLVLGIISLVQHRAGYGMAIAGVAMCSLGIVAAIVAAVVVYSAYDTSGGSLDSWRRFLEQYSKSGSYVRS